MNITDLFIKRPVMTALVMIGIVLFGIAGYRALPVSDLPNVDFPTIQVSASLPGASPETMATAVATPLERQFATVAGIDSMTSTSGVGSHRHHHPVSRSTGRLTAPPRMSRTPSQRCCGCCRRECRRRPHCASESRRHAGDHAGAFRPTLQLSKLDEYAENLMAQRISSLDGVAQVNVFGAQKWAIHVQLDPSLLAARHIGIDEVSNALQAHNVNQPTGTLWGANQAFTVRANGQLMTSAAFGDMICGLSQRIPCPP